MWDNSTTTNQPTDNNRIIYMDTTSAMEFQAKRYCKLSYVIILLVEDIDVQYVMY